MNVRPVFPMPQYLSSLKFGILLGAIFALASCGEEAQPEPTAQTVAEVQEENVSIGKISGTIAGLPVDFTLTASNSSVTIAEWEGLSKKSITRESGEMSLEAFLMGPELWVGPPRLITITHGHGNNRQTLRFAGRLAVDESLQALPGNHLTTAGKEYLPLPSGTWETAKKVTLASYRLELIVDSYDDKTGHIRGKVRGVLFDPSDSKREALPVELEIDAMPYVEQPKPEADHVAETTPAPKDPESTTEEESPPPAPEETSTPPAPEVVEEPEIRRAVPVEEPVEEDEKEEQPGAQPAIPVQDRRGF